MKTPAVCSGTIGTFSNRVGKMLETTEKQRVTDLIQSRIKPARAKPLMLNNRS
jgi:hypothetical protein